MDLSFNPFIIITIILAIAGITAYAVIDIKKNTTSGSTPLIFGNKIESDINAEDLLKNVTSGVDKQLIPINLNVGNFRNYRKYSKEETMVYNSASFFDRIRIALRSHLNKKYNLLNEQEYLVLLLIGITIGGVIGWWAMGSLPFIIGVAVIGAITPEVYLKMQVKSYKEEINKQATALIQLVIQAMRTGLSIGEAFERGAAQLEGPIEKEVEILSEYFRSGFSFQDAARMAIDETASSFLRKIYQIIIMSLETNISPEKLIERLTIIRKNLINEFYLKQSMKAEAGGGTLAKNILIVIVPSLLFIVVKNSSDMLKPLIESPKGWAVIFAGVALYSSGIIFSNKVMNKLDV